MSLDMGDLRSAVASVASDPPSLDRVVFCLLRAPEGLELVWLEYALRSLESVRIGKSDRWHWAPEVLKCALCVREVLDGCKPALADEAAAGYAWALAHWMLGEASASGLRVCVWELAQQKRPWFGRPTEVRALYIWGGGYVEHDAEGRHLWKRPMEVHAKWHDRSPVWKRSRLRDLRHLAPAPHETLPLFGGVA